MPDINITRLTAVDTDRARELFVLMADVFQSEKEPLSDSYLARLLSRDDFWALVASVEGRIVGGLTAHTLPLTRAEVSEIFIYDLAVLEDYQRQGIGRALVARLRSLAAAAGVGVLFVPADNEDTHALAFYRAIGGDPAPVTIFTFSDEPE